MQNDIPCEDFYLPQKNDKYYRDIEDMIQYIDFENSDETVCQFFEDWQKAINKIKMETIKLEETPRVALFDFGFTLTTEEELKRDTLKSLTATQVKLTQLKEMFWPLLENLKKDPDKEIIRWPNRVKTIDDFMRKVEDFIASNPE